MRGPKPDPLSLSEIARNELERLVRRHTTVQQVALRGRIILEADWPFASASGRGDASRGDPLACGL